MKIGFVFVPIRVFALDSGLGNGRGILVSNILVRDLFCHVSFFGFLDFWSICWISGPLLFSCFSENRELISGQLHKVSSSRLSFLAYPILVARLFIILIKMS